MDASQDVWDWDWEVLPDHRTSFSTSHGSKNLDVAVVNQETKERDLVPPSGDVDVHDEPVDQCKDIGVVPDDDETTKPVPSVVADLTASEDGGEDEKKKAFQSTPDANDDAAAAADDDEDDDGKCAQEEEKDTKKEQEQEQEQQQEEDDNDDGKARPPQCLVFSVGKLKVNGIGALCSFGVAAATVCIFLIGGRLQHHHHRQQEQQKIQLQFYGDDKRIQQVVQQTSRLNQAMSSVMGAGGASSTRANISFGGFYDGF